MARVDLPLVCLHKLGGWAAEWKPLAATLDRQVVAVDLPGHGTSATIAPPYIQRVEDSAAGLIDHLDALGIAAFDLIGTSLGGAVAVRMAALLQERVARLTLVSVALTPSNSIDAMRQIDARTGRALYGDGDRPLPRSAADIERLFGVVDPIVQADLIAARDAAGSWIRPSWRGASIADVCGWLPHVSAPVKLVYGARGGYRQFEAAGRALLRTVSVHEVPDCGAFPHQEKPRALAAILSLPG